MKSSRLFLLDIGGVILTDPLAELFVDLAGGGIVSEAEIGAFYTTQLRLRLWNGQLPEAEFWRALLTLAGAPESAETWRRHLLALMRPLPAAAHLAELAEHGVIVALSNHRHEWLIPVLERSDLTRHFSHLFISSQTGLVKPDARAVAGALELLAVAPEHATFVDDKERNLETARPLGLAVVLADASGLWLQTLLRENETGG